MNFPPRGKAVSSQSSEVQTVFSNTSQLKKIGLTIENRQQTTYHMLNSLRIEPANLDDLPKLADLLYDLFSQEADFTPNRDKQMRGLKLILEQPSRGRIFVMRNESHMIGMINLLITISTAEGGFVLLLEDLIIHTKHRRQGYGSRLLRHAIEFAREKKFLRITLLTDKPNENAKKFFLREGFTESDMMPLRMILNGFSGKN